MSCASVREQMSAYLEGDLEGAAAHAFALHLDLCAACADHLRTLRCSLELLASVPRLAPEESIAQRMRDALEVRSRGPALAALFRPAWAARPLILPSVLPAAMVLAVVMGGLLMMGARDSRVAWEHTHGSGSQADPFSPTAGLGMPRMRAGGLSDELLSHVGEGNLFYAAVVNGDGTVSDLRVLDGGDPYARWLIHALRNERFDPLLYKGQPVSVSVFRLISRMEVRAPIT